MTSSEVSAGLVLPYAALTVAGKGGAAAIVLITFMAVTSTLSAQVIAVSSIISFDIYREYFNKGATDRQIIRWSHFGVVFFALFSAGFSTMLYYVGADLQWTLYMLGEFYLSIYLSIYPFDRGCVQLFIIFRRRHLPRHFPHGLHHPLAPTEHPRRHPGPRAGHGHRPGRLAGHGTPILRRGHRLDDRTGAALRLRHRGVRLLAHPVLDHHHVPDRAAELRLEGL